VYKRQLVGFNGGTSNDSTLSSNPNHSFFNHQVRTADSFWANGLKLTSGAIDISASAATDVMIKDGTVNIGLIAFYNGLYESGSGLIDLISSADQVTNAHAWDVRWVTRGYGDTRYLRINQDNIVGAGDKFVSRDQLDLDYWRQDDADLEQRFTDIEARLVVLEGHHGITPPAP